MHQYGVREKIGKPFRSLYTCRALEHYSISGTRHRTQSDKLHSRTPLFPIRHGYGKLTIVTVILQINQLLTFTQNYKFINGLSQNIHIRINHLQILPLHYQKSL
jgi:hypothetical protein